LESKVIIGIDLAGKEENPTGWALWKNKKVETSILYSDNEILREILQNNPTLIAIDAPFHLPKTGLLRKADREMIKHGYRVFPPVLPAMKKLTLRAIRLNKRIVEYGYKAIEVHPTSTRKALSMPLKDWRKIQTVLTTIGLRGDLIMKKLTAHELDAVTAALTAYLHLKNQTETLGNAKEGYIIVPKRRNWRELKIE